MKPLVLGSFYLLFSSALFAAQPTAEAWNVLHEGLNSGNPEVRKQALIGVGAIGNLPEAVRIEVNALHTDKDPEVRQVAALQLGQMKATEAARDLEVALDDPDPQVAFTAAQSLWKMGNYRSKGELQDVLTGQVHNHESFVEKNIRDAKKTMRNPKEMAKIGVKEASGALLGPFSIGVTAAEGFMKDDGASGRATAAALLAEDCDARAFQLLDWTLENDHNWAVRAAVAKAIGQCGHREEVPKLETYLGDNHSAMRLMAAGAIIRLNSIEPAMAEGSRTSAPQPREQSDTGEASRMVLRPHAEPQPEQQSSATQEMQKALAPAASSTP
ncbi:MAG TPA: HEAT repeat domain-containing protein [Bryobacteraceae bacterium]|nr:HEAT repeat domain-containing protein [Bryobacteraceae bacterium]